MVVSPLGSDADDCGRTEDEACVYLNTTLLLAGAGDTILVDWRAARLRPDWLCGGSALRLDRPLTLAGHGGRAHIGCPVGGERRLALRIAVPRAPRSEHPAGERVVFRSLDFTSAEFLIEDAQLTFARCSLVDCRLRSTPTSRLVDFVIERSVWRGVTATPKPHFRFQFTSELEVDAQEVRCRIARSEFYNTPVNLTASRQLSVRVGDARFSNAPPHLSVLGGLQLTVREGETRSDVTIADSVFERQANDDPICAILHMYGGAVTVSVLEPAPGSVLSNVHVSLDRVLLSHNARGLSISGPLHAVRSSRTTPSSTTALHCTSTQPATRSPPSPTARWSTMRPGGRRPRMSPTPAIRCTSTGTASGSLRTVATECCQRSAREAP